MRRAGEFFLSLADSNCPIDHTPVLIYFSEIFPYKPTILDTLQSHEARCKSPSYRWNFPWPSWIPQRSPSWRGDGRHSNTEKHHLEVLEIMWNPASGPFWSPCLFVMRKKNLGWSILPEADPSSRLLFCRGNPWIIVETCFNLSNPVGDYHQPWNSLWSITVSHTIYRSINILYEHTIDHLLTSSFNIY